MFEFFIALEKPLNVASTEARSVRMKNIDMFHDSFAISYISIYYQQGSLKDRSISCSKSSRQFLWLQRRSLVLLLDQNDHHLHVGWSDGRHCEMARVKEKNNWMVRQLRWINLDKSFEASKPLCLIAWWSNYKPISFATANISEKFWPDDTPF